jgi:hypothetical protein
VHVVGEVEVDVAQLIRHRYNMNYFDKIHQR